jgi:hypothetical protein
MVTTIDRLPGTTFGENDVLRPQDAGCYPIELVQWPPGHPDGITAADSPDDHQDDTKEN